MTPSLPLSVTGFWGSSPFAVNKRVFQRLSQGLPFMKPPWMQGCMPFQEAESRLAVELLRKSGRGRILEGCPVCNFPQAIGPHSKGGYHGKLLDLNQYQAQWKSGVQNLILLMKFLGKSLKLPSSPVKWQ